MNVPLSYPKISPVYGYAHERPAHFKMVRERGRTPMTIDEYNGALGLNGGPIAFLAKYPALMSLLKGARAFDEKADLFMSAIDDMAGKFGSEGVSDKVMTARSSRQRLHAKSWLDFLTTHHQKLDLRNVLRTMAENDPGMVLNFISKNDRNGSGLDLEIQTGLMAKFVESASFDALLAEVPDVDQLRWIGEVISTAFFRQTSKLGLHWFVRHQGEMKVARIDFVMNGLTTPRQHGRMGEQTAQMPTLALQRQSAYKSITQSEHNHAIKHPGICRILMEVRNPSPSS